MSKILITGGVAGGATAAARLRRLDENAEIVMFERGEHISFANCGLPYYIGGVIKKRDDLFVTTKEDFSGRYAIDIRNYSEVIAINREQKKVTVKNLLTNETYHETYDKLILSTGAEPSKLPIDGMDIDTVYTLRNVRDTDQIRAVVDDKSNQSAVIVGGGFIGLEMAENFIHKGLRVTLIELGDQVMAPLDPEMAAQVHEYLREKGVNLELGTGVKAFVKQPEHIDVITDSGNHIPCDFVLVSAGVRPENKLAMDAGLTISSNGGIVTNEKMVTSDPDIYAVGDASQISDFITGDPIMVPLAGPANKQGRIAADNALGRSSDYKGVIGTSVLKLFDMSVASTGLNEKTLKQKNIPYLKSYTASGSHAGYYPGADRMTIKLLFSNPDGRVLGAQIIGKKGVDKRIDVIATAIKGRLTVSDLEELELAYAPPFSSAKDPVNMAGYVASNILKGDVTVIFPDELDDLDRSETIILDLRTNDEIRNLGAIDGFINIPVDDLRQKLPELDKSKTYVLYCAIGLRGYIAWRIMNQKGFKVKNLSGGLLVYNNFKKD